MSKKFWNYELMEGELKRLIKRSMHKIDNTASSYTDMNLMKSHFDFYYTSFFSNRMIGNLSYWQYVSSFI